MIKIYEEKIRIEKGQMVGCDYTKLSSVIELPTQPLTDSGEAYIEIDNQWYLISDVYKTPKNLYVMLTKHKINPEIIDLIEKEE